MEENYSNEGVSFSYRENDEDFDNDWDDSWRIMIIMIRDNENGDHFDDLYDDCW